MKLFHRGQLAGAFLLLALGVVSVQGTGGAGLEWGYSGATGPEHWGGLKPEFGLCATGRNQSPINLTAFIEAELQPLTLRYGSEAVEVVNNGHTVQVNFASTSVLEVEGREYGLLQIHFHSPSENVIDGRSYPLEGHLVHTDASGQLAVVAVMYAEGEENSAIATAWQQMPEVAGAKAMLSGVGTGEGFLPGSRAYYRFNGSLTTPPCTEGVTWLVLKEAATISPAQLKHFQQVIGEANNRPVQPINARVVLQ